MSSRTLQICVLFPSLELKSAKEALTSSGSFPLSLALVQMTRRSKAAPALALARNRSKLSSWTAPKFWNTPLPVTSSKYAAVKKPSMAERPAKFSNHCKSDFAFTTFVSRESVGEMLLLLLEDGDFRAAWSEPLRGVVRGVGRRRRRRLAAIELPLPLLLWLFFRTFNRCLLITVFMFFTFFFLFFFNC